MKKIFAAFMALFVFIISACGNGETPEQAVVNALTAVKNLDKETAQKYFDSDKLAGNRGENDLMENEEYAKLLVKNLTFNVLSSSINGDEAVVKTEITNTDLRGVLAEYIKRAFASTFAAAFTGELSDEEIQKQNEQILIELLQREGNQTLTSTVDIKLAKNGNSWRIVADEALADAILGGMLSAAKSFGGEDATKGDGTGPENPDDSEPSH